MNGLAGLNCYETNNQQLHIREKVVVLLIACMAANEEFKIKDKNISFVTKNKVGRCVRQINGN